MTDINQVRETTSNYNIYLSAVKTLKLFGVEEKSSRLAMTMLLTLTNSQSSTTKWIGEEQSLMRYSSLFELRM